tara:strand:- start:4 stop:564 length:561 start_codon:yes stop_codon:yes gene_type:complete
MSLNEVVENIKARSIQSPDELAVVNKWDILMLLCPGLTKDKVKTQKKNYSKLKTDNMLFLCIDTICKLFLDMIYLDSRPDMPNDRISLRSFKHMIRMKVDELDELESELEKVKEGKGYILEEEHDKEIKTMKQEFKFQKEEYEKKINKLENTENYLREKIDKVEERVEKKLEMKYAGWKPPVTSTD